MKTVNLKTNELSSKVVKAEDLYNGGQFYKLTTLKMPKKKNNEENEEENEEEACLLSSNVLYGEKSRTKTTALLAHEDNMGAEIARQAKQAISEIINEAGGVGWIESLEKVEMKKVFYAVDSSGRWKQDGEGEEDEEIQEDGVSLDWNTSDGADLFPQFYPHTNYRRVNDDDSNDVLAVRFFFVPERLQNTIPGTKKDDLDKMLKEFNNEK
jgi:hypothetical protein